MFFFFLNFFLIYNFINIIGSWEYIYTNYIFYPLIYLLNQTKEFFIPSLFHSHEEKLNLFYAPTFSSLSLVGGEKVRDRRDLVFSHVSLVGGGKVEGWKTLLFGWEEKWKDKKYSLDRFTLMLVLHNFLKKNYKEKKKKTAVGVKKSKNPNI